MAMILKNSLVYIIILVASVMTAQVESDVYTDNSPNLKGVIFRKEFAMDFRLHTNGWAIGADFGKIITFYRTSYYQLEFGGIKDPRENKQGGIILPTFQVISDNYKYAKQNSLFVLRGGIGRKRFISEKARRKGISLGYSYSYGPAIGILKPYYLDLIYHIEKDGMSYDEIRSEKFSQENADKFLDKSQIFGYSGFSKGLSEIGISPGAQGKGSLFFSVGAYDQYLKSLEVGIMADVFFNKMPLMVETSLVSNKPYFVNLFINLQIGKRSN